jgi:hypothetical protein
MSEINLKRKVTLKRKGEPGEKPSESKPNKLIWFAILGVIAVVTFFGIKQFDDKGESDLQTVIQIPTDTLVQEGNGVETISKENEPAASDLENEEGSGKSVVSQGASSSVGVVNDKSNTTDNSSVSKPTLTETPSSNNTSNSGNESSSETLTGSVDEKARRTIRGDFGNGADRKNLLGSDYNSIQAKVNEMYKSGLSY